MPLAFDPAETFPASLATDVGKPEAERPTFHFRYLSSRGYRERTKLVEEWDKYFDDRAQREKARQDAKVTPEDLVKLLTQENEQSFPAYERLLKRTYQALEDQCTGWQNVPPLYARGLLDTVLTDPEARELLGISLRMNRLQVAEKKDSGSPSSGEPEKSAPAGAAPVASDSPRPTTGSQLAAPPAKDAIPSAPSAAEATDSSR